MKLILGYKSVQNQTHLLTGIWEKKSDLIQPGDEPMPADLKEFKELVREAQSHGMTGCTPAAMKKITEMAWTEHAMRIVRALKRRGAVDVLLDLVEKHDVSAVAR